LKAELRVIVCAFVFLFFGSALKSSDAPQFSDFPADTFYPGKPGAPKLNSTEPLFRGVVADGIRQGVNFAGHFILVRFQIGNGPIGAAIVDARTGSVYHLPKEVVASGYFLGSTACLSLNEGRSYLDEEDTSPLSFRSNSELLIIRQCNGNGFDRSYYLWYQQRWRLVAHLVLPPPPLSE
jgi:hypothetical protein